MFNLNNTSSLFLLSEEIFYDTSIIKYFLSSLSIISAIFVIATKNPIISVFNLIVLYILVAFYLIYIGVAFIGISYIIIYIGAIAILFLFIIMMIDVEVVEKRNSNYLLLLFFLICGFLLTVENFIMTLGKLKINGISLLIKQKGKNFEENWILNNNKFIDYQDSLFSLNSANIDIDILYPKESNFYLLITPTWEFSIERITQIAGLGDVLYSIYSIFIYIITVILLLAMVGAIILTAEDNQKLKYVAINYKKNAIALVLIHIFIELFYFIKNKITLCYDSKVNVKIKTSVFILPFISFDENSYLLDSLMTLIYYIIIISIVAILLVVINVLFSVKSSYWDKKGGFECGFSSFFQTRERFNIIFYRFGILFLLFDLEIILIYPYTASTNKRKRINKNNVGVFVTSISAGFVFEINGGALNFKDEDKKYSNYILSPSNILVNKYNLLNNKYTSDFITSNLNNLYNYNDKSKFFIKENSFYSLDKYSYSSVFFLVLPSSISILFINIDTYPILFLFY